MPFTFSTVSSHGLTIYKILRDYAQARQPARPRLYQVDELFLLHTEAGVHDYILHPTGGAAGLADNPAQPIPVDLAVVTISESHSPGDIEAHVREQFAASTRQVWLIDARNQQVTVRTRSGSRTYQAGERVADPELPGFSLDVSSIFEGEAQTVTLTSAEKAYLRTLIYPAQFERDPLNAVGRVLDQIRAGEGLESAPGEIAAIVERGLASDAALADLIPQDHPEDVIRAFLSEVARRLRAEDR